MSQQGPLQPFLYENTDRTVVLIDIPTSIAAAQGAEAFEIWGKLLSLEPRQQPFPSQEPKSEIARAKVGRNTVDSELHECYQVLIQQALAEISRNYPGDWCSPRKIVSIDRDQSKKRKRGHFGISENTELSSVNADTKPPGPEHVAPTVDYPAAVLLPSLLQQLSRRGNRSSSDALAYSMSWKPVTDISHSHVEAAEGGPSSFGQPWVSSFHNPYGTPLELSIMGPLAGTSSSPAAYVFLVPPQATFFLGDCKDSTSFRAVLRNLSQEYSVPRHFDVILLDPPWPNASVKRKDAYSTGSNLRDIKQLLYGMDLDTLIAPNGLVGIWITNSPLVREFVLGPGGFFDCLNVALIEEWIWIKTTVHGEPIGLLDSVWRKPYEVFLLAKAPANSLVAPEATEEVTRRIIAAVPDLHSRKPCMKNLLEPLTTNPTDYRALEVFARHLIEGWCSWSDEVLKFNWYGYWAGAGGQEQHSGVRGGECIDTTSQNP